MSYAVGIDEPETTPLAAALPAYEIGTELGRGAHGVVLDARHRQLGRMVAIKQLPRVLGMDPALRSRFLVEARVLAALDHPHIVEIYDFVEHDGACLLVMERLNGGTVRSRLDRGRLTPDVACAILLAVCAGLHHAHRHGVLHRDVKPENLLFARDGTVKITDLGIAKVVGRASMVASRVGRVLGTPAYIAPEQVQGLELTPATDVYQAGTVLFELLTGRLPFPVDCDPATLLYRHVHESPPPLLAVAHDVPARLASIVDRAIATSPADRYQSAEEFGVAIANCAASTWGRGWLARTTVPLSASGAILTAALGGQQPSAEAREPAALQSVRPRPDRHEPVSELRPVHVVYPELSSGANRNVGRGSGGDEGRRGPAPLTVATPALAIPRSDGQSSPSRRPRRRGVVAAVVAAVVAVLLAAVPVAMLNLGKSPRHRAGSTAWRSLPNAPTARQEGASTLWNGIVWLFGGLHNGVATNTVEGYDPTIATWESGPSLPVALDHDTAVVYHDEPVVLGGWIGNGSKVDTGPSNWVLTLHNGQWVSLPPMHHPRAAAAAAVVDGKIVVTGGQANHQLVAQTEVFDGTQWTDVAPMPTLRDHLAGVGDGKYFYAVGGRELSADKNVGAVERYDPATNTWASLPGLPTPRGGLGAAIAGNLLVTLGGETTTAAFDTVEVLDLTTNRWTTLPAMKTPRHGMAVAAVGHTIYAIDGGGAPGAGDPLTVNDAFDA